MQGDTFQLDVGFPDARAQKGDDGPGKLRPGRNQMLQARMRQRHGADRPDGRGVGRPPPAVEGGDLAEYVARPGIEERQLAALAGEDREPDAAFGDEVDVLADVAAGKNGLPCLKARLPHLPRHIEPARIAERSEQLSAAQQLGYADLVSHVTVPLNLHRHSWYRARRCGPSI